MVHHFLLTLPPMDSWWPYSVVMVLIGVEYTLRCAKIQRKDDE